MSSPANHTRIVCDTRAAYLALPLWMKKRADVIIVAGRVAKAPPPPRPFSFWVVMGGFAGLLGAVVRKS